jgi:hypothetical protein
MQTKLQLSEAERKAFDDRGFVPRWVNDQDGRIQAALNGGWNFVDPAFALSVGGNVEADQAKISKVVSRGEERKVAYLMEIPKKFFDEDKQAKIDQTLKVDESLRPVDQGGQSVESGYTPN